MKTASKFSRYFIPTMIIAIGAAFIAIGIKDGEAKAVIIKAIAICMECIGIG